VFGDGRYAVPNLNDFHVRGGTRVMQNRMEAAARNHRQIPKGV